MFWKSVAAYSKINDLLLRPDLTVKELLDDDDILQKCREKDPLLISFLSQSDTLDSLIDLVSHTPVSDDFDENLYKYSSLACEILTNDISEILDGIIELTTPTTSEHHNSNESNNNNNINNGNNMMESKGITSSSPTSSSPISSSLMILDNHKPTNYSNFDTVNNNSSELCQINSNHSENPNGNDNGNDTNHLSSSMSIVDESSSISNQEDHLLSNDNSEKDLHELFSSKLKLSPPMSLSTPQSSRKVTTTTATSNTDIDKVSPTITRRRVDMLIRFFNCSNQSVNPLSASFVSRLLIHLTLHRGKVIIPYLRSSKDFLEQLFSSLDSCSVADLIVQLAQQETNQQHIIFEWFKTDRLVERLIEKFDPIYSSETHESAAHCLIELIVVLRNYLINNPLTLDTNEMPDNSATATTPTTTGITTHNHDGNNSRNLSGLSLDSSFSNNEETYKAAENLLNILESEETMSLIFNRILSNEYVLPSIMASCVNVFMAVMGKKKPESCLTFSEDGQAINFEALLKTLNHKNTNELYSGDISTNFNASFHNSNVNKINNQNDVNCISNTNSRINDNAVRLNQFDELSRDSTTSIDKLHIMKASENLIKACLPRLPELHDLLQRFHPQFYNTIPTTNGVLSPPLGRCRLAILQLIAALLSIPFSTELPKAIVDSGFVKTSMKLFSSYPYNTFLHHYVTDIIKSLFKHLGFIDNNFCNTGNNGSMSGKMNSNVTTPTSVASNQPITVDISFDRDNQPTESLSSSASSSSSSPDSPSSTTTSIESTNSDVISSTDQSNPVDVNKHDNPTQIISEVNDSHSSLKNTAMYSNELSRNVVVSLMKDHRIIEWCLALSPLPSRKKRSKEANSTNSVVRLCKLDRKPDLHPKLQNMWSDFIKDLNVINAVQVTEFTATSLNKDNLLYKNSDYAFHDCIISSFHQFCLLCRVPFILSPVKSSNLMQNKLSDVNEKLSSDLLDDYVDNDNTIDVNSDEFIFNEPLIPAYTIGSLREDATLRDVLNSWLDPDKESESSDDNNNSAASGEQVDTKGLGLFVVVPGPLRPWHTVSSDEYGYDDDDDYFLNSDDNNDDENDGSEDSQSSVSDRSSVNGNGNEDDDDDDEEDLKSPIQIKQQHSNKRRTTKLSTFGSTLCNYPYVIYKELSESIHNLKSASMIGINNDTSSGVSGALSTDLITTNEHKDSSNVSTSNTKNNLFSSEDRESDDIVKACQPFLPGIKSNIFKKYVFNSNSTLF
ncbi:hypothetical protein MN116_007572 [Schistosoma mekongi]|uniref:Uncharacterized protein n=1 Tax=Schistosoma mekongi TaxID=38744 RepID=A0AAE2D3F7_SCHME|nr:hypothetical protein MN116_007572 [Schistosoma mekongi]